MIGPEACAQKHEPYTQQVLRVNSHKRCIPFTPLLPLTSFFVSTGLEPQAHRHNMDFPKRAWHVVSPSCHIYLCLPLWGLRTRSPTPQPRSTCFPVARTCHGQCWHMSAQDNVLQLAPTVLQLSPPGTSRSASRRLPSSHSCCRTPVVGPPMDLRRTGGTCHLSACSFDMPCGDGGAIATSSRLRLPSSSIEPGIRVPTKPSKQRNADFSKSCSGCELASPLSHPS